MNPRVLIRSRTIIQLGGIDCEFNYFLSSKLALDLGKLAVGEEVYGYNPTNINAEVSVMIVNS
jgi:hypothetical protein